jgi:hypothetical protein
MTSHVERSLLPRFAINACDGTLFAVPMEEVFGVAIVSMSAAAPSA